MIIRYATKPRYVRGILARRHYSSKSQSKSTPPKTKDTSTPPGATPPPPIPNAEEINSAIVERMKQILEDKITHDVSNLSTLKQVDSSINSIFEKYSPTPPSSTITQAKSYIKSEPLLQQNKHARDIYNAQPWSGEESNIDANLRMIVDLKPKAMKVPVLSSRKLASPHEKLAQARDISLDYKLAKDSPTQEPNDNFRELYRERLLGPDQFVPLSSSTSDFVGSVASNKINAEIDLKTGRFESADMANVRGKPLNREHLQNATDSNYFMNQILNKQSVLPPWIESQRGINSEIARFRSKIDDMWFKWILYRSEIAGIVKVSNNLEVIEHAFEKNISGFTFIKQNLDTSDLEYVNAKIDSLNKQIRDYNLQCPSVSGHKFKLSVDKELKDSYWRTLENFSRNLEVWFDKHKRKRSPLQANRESSLPGFLNLWGDDGSEPHIATATKTGDQDSKLHIWKAVKDIFKKK